MTNRAPTPTKILAVSCFLLIGLCELALARDVRHPDANSNFVAGLYAEPVDSTFSNLRKLLEVREAFELIEYRSDADALLAYMSRKIMRDMLGEPLGLEGIRTVKDALTAERTSLEPREPLAALRERVAAQLSIRLIDSTGDELGGEGVVYLGNSLWAKAYPSINRTWHHLRVQTTMGVKMPVEDFYFAARLRSPGQDEKLYFECRPNVPFENQAKRPYEPGATIDTACTLHYPIQQDTLLEAITALTAGKSSLAFTAFSIDLRQPSFTFHSTPSLGVDHSFSRVDLSKIREMARARVYRTNCRDRGSCWKDARETGFFFRSLVALSTIAAIFFVLRAFSRVARRRAPVLFVLAACVYVAAFVAARYAEQVESMGAIVFIAPAYFLGMPWDLFDLPLVGVRSDVDRTEVAAYGGMTLNLLIIAALTLWRRAPQDGAR